MKLAITLILSLAVAGSALASTNSTTLTIRHQMHGCHSWSFDGQSWKVSQSTTMTRGSVLTVVDNDVMPHKLVQVSGPKALVTGAAMTHMGGKAHVVFIAKGTYAFTTKPGEDYVKGVTTTGEDNVLRLVVKVA
jgi:hypothetical protein